VKKHPNGAVVVVTHFFALLIIICQAIGIDLDNFGRLVEQRGTAISILEFREQGVSLVLF
jgi:broad specificity phosphatase PhoE